MIFKLIIITSCFVAAAHSGLVGRIIGGRDAKPGEFPHQVSLQFGLPPLVQFTHFCGGSIINSQWILTAAHCVEAFEELSNFGIFLIKAGKQDLTIVEDTQQTTTVKSYFKHEKYEGNQTVGPFDIALVKLEEPLRLNKRVSSIKFPEKDSEPSGNVVLSGWGAITNRSEPDFPTILQTVEVPIIERKACNEAIEKLGLEEGKNLTNIVHETNVCTGPLIGGISACQGDSGGPLIAKNKNGQIELIGVASYAADPCGRKGGVTVWVRVSSFIDWIDNIMANN